jgi:hypothetical protein
MLPGLDLQRDHSAAGDFDPFAFEVRERAYPIADEARQTIASPGTATKRPILSGT